MKRLNKILIVGLVAMQGLIQAQAGAGPVQSASQAGFAPKQADVMTPWLDEKHPTCGQSCLYSKAAENIMLQADRLTGKISDQKVRAGHSGINELKREIDVFESDKNQLKQIIRQNPGSSAIVLPQIKALDSDIDAREQQMSNILGNFCTVDTNGNKEDVKKCGQRYVHTHGLVLLSMQQAITANKDKVAQLADHRFSNGSNALRTEISLPRADSKEFDNLKVLLPHLPSYDELQKMDLAIKKDEISGKLLPFTREDYESWASDLSHRPNENDNDEKQLFVKSESIKLGASVDTYWMIKRDVKGAAQVDQISFNKRKSFLDKLYKSPGKDLVTGKDLPSNMEVYRATMLSDDNLKRVTKILDARKVDRTLEWKSGQAALQNEIIYNGVRGENVDLVNQQLVGSGFSKNMNLSKKINPAVSGAVTSAFYSGNKKLNEVLIKDTIKNNKVRTPSMTFTIQPNYYNGVVDDIMDTWQ